MTDVQIETLVSGIKTLEAGQKENREQIKELQTAMIGSVDGTRPGFGQQLLRLMEAMDKIGPRIERLEEYKIRTEGAWSGGKLVVGAICGLLGLLIGLIGVMLKK